MGLPISNISTPRTFVNTNEGQTSAHDWYFVNPFPDLSPAGSWTVEAWAGTDDLDSQFNRIVDLAFGGGRHAYSLFVKDGMAGLQVSTASGEEILQGGPIVADGGGHHIAGVYDSVAQDLILYVDGVEAARHVGVDTPVTSVFPLQIGRGTNPYQFFDGGIVEVRVWSTALTQPEIVQYAIDLDPVPQTDLQLYVGFNNGVAIDASNNTNTVFTNGNPVADSALLFHAGVPDLLKAQSAFSGSILINSDLGDVTYTLESSGGVFELGYLPFLTNVAGNGTGSVSFKGSLGDVNTALSNTVFSPNPGFTGTTTIDISISDINGLIE